MCFLCGACRVAQCSPGSWCSTETQIPCSQNTFNPRPAAHLITDCERCPERTSTLGVDGATSAEACVCGEDFYRADLEHATDRRGCVDRCCTCPIGTSCPGGTPLVSLPLKRGYFRLDNTSADVRRCPDAAANCKGRNECPASTSGCRGGPNVSEVCMPTLAGVFCRECAHDDAYYVEATPERSAHCKPCASAVENAFSSEGNMIAIYVVSVAGLAFVMLILCCYRLPPRLHARRRRVQQRLQRAWHKAAREYMVLNKVRTPRRSLPKVL